METNTGTKSNSSTSATTNNTQQRRTPDSHVRKLMLDTWSNSIFNAIKHRLQNSAMKIIYSERIGEPFDSQLVIGVRESYGLNNFYKILTRKKILSPKYFFFMKIKFF